MNYIRGKVKQIIYESDTGFKVLLFKIKETNDEELQDAINKSIKVTGTFGDLNEENTYKLYGEYIEHPRYGYSYRINNYEKEEIQGTEAIIDFLSSPLIKGCGEKTATAIVDTLGENALDLIKDNYEVLLRVPGISEVKARRIYKSIQDYNQTDSIIVELKRIGFSINEALLILKTWGESSLLVVKNSLYKLRDIIDFPKLDKIYLLNNKPDTEDRIKACIIECFNYGAYKEGHTYLTFDDILSYLQIEYKIFTDDITIDNYIEDLIKDKQIVKKRKKYFSKEYYDRERDIAYNLMLISKQKKEKITNYDSLISSLEIEYDVKYNIDQKKAIKNALTNPISIITGGPGTGKTTIINTIVKLYIRINRLTNREIMSDIALLAPTGRASKKMTEATGLGAMTIHRFLKWNKEKNEFQVNEYNPNKQKLVIVDETSMIDTILFDSLLKGLNHNIKLIIVGDENQLPSVGPGLILNDLIDSELFTHTNLERIYRQSPNSYIPILAQEIKEKRLSEDYMYQKDDYNLIEIPSTKIKDTIKQICIMSKEKGINEETLQVLAPLYRGENGIDNLNKIIQSIYNPEDENKNETKYGDVIYREHDKVLQLVNDPDNNIFNGDIGYITKIETIYDPKRKEIITIDFDGNKVEYNREDLINIKHAYCISIHKSQGSEFPHVIIPISRIYHNMLYNKLIYTGVSRAKKSLILLGESDSLIMAINNEYSTKRQTNLKEELINAIKEE